MTALSGPARSGSKFSKLTMRLGIATLFIILAVTGGVIVSGHGKYLAQVLGAKPHFVKVTWNPSTSPGVVGYNVYRAIVQGGQTVKLNHEPVRVPEYTDHEVEAGRTYYYGVTAVDGKNIESVRTAPITVTVPKP